MRTTLAVAGVYAGVALAAPSAEVQGAQAGQADWWPWSKQSPSQANSKPKSNGPDFGLWTGASPSPFGSFGSKPSSGKGNPSGGFWNMFKGFGQNSNSSPSSPFGGQSGRKPGAGSGPVGWGSPAAPKAPAAPAAAEAEAEVAAPAAPIAPAAPAALEAPAAAEAPAAESITAEAESAAKPEAPAPKLPASPKSPKAPTAPKAPKAPKAPAGEAETAEKELPRPPKAPSAAPTTTKRQKLWQPKVASPFQIVLTGTVDSSVKLTPEFVEIFDIDLFNTPKSSIQALSKQGKKVICYFSAGSSENWRSDFNRFKAADMGKGVSKDDKGSSYWEGEKWLNVRSQNVWNIMRDRIKLAADKGCHAIDPDNTDAYENNNGLGMTQNDAVKYMKFMADEAQKYNMSIGLKNSMDILPKVQDFVQFAVNEECAAVGECHQYQNFLRTKPVFHIEYTKTKSGGVTIGSDKEYGRGPSKGLGSFFGGGRKPSKRDVQAVEASVAQHCNIKTAPDLGPKFSTVIKVEDLDGWVQFCDGRTANTRVVAGGRSRYSDSESEGGDADEAPSRGSLGKATQFGGFGKANADPEESNARGPAASFGKGSQFGGFGGFGTQGAEKQPVAPVAPAAPAAQASPARGGFGSWGTQGAEKQPTAPSFGKGAGGFGKANREQDDDDDEPKARGSAGKGAQAGGFGGFGGFGKGGAGAEASRGWGGFGGRQINRDEDDGR